MTTYLEQRKVWEAGQPVKRNLMRKNREYTIYTNDGRIVFAEMLSKFNTRTSQAAVIWLIVGPNGIIQSVETMRFHEIAAIYQNSQEA